MAKLLKPSFLELGLVDLRNIKMGLIAHELQRQDPPLMPDETKTTAILLGNFHALATNPTLPEEQLLGKMRDYIQDIIPFVRNVNLASDTVMRKEMKSILAGYMIYEWGEQDRYSSSGQKLCPQIEKMIDECWV